MCLPPRKLDVVIAGFLVFRLDRPDVIFPVVLHDDSGAREHSCLARVDGRVSDHVVRVLVVRETVELRRELCHLDGVAVSKLVAICDVQVRFAQVWDDLAQVRLLLEELVHNDFELLRLLVHVPERFMLGEIRVIPALECLNVTKRRCARFVGQLEAFVWVLRVGQFVGIRATQQRLIVVMATSILFALLFQGPGKGFAVSVF